MPRNPQSVLIRRRWNLTRRENTLLPSILISLTLAFAVSRYSRHPRAPPRHPRHLEDAEAVRARSGRRRASSVTMSPIWANAHGRIKVEVVTARLCDPPRLSPQGTSCSPLLRIWYVAVRAHRPGSDRRSPSSALTSRAQPGTPPHQAGSREARPVATSGAPPGTPPHHAGSREARPVAASGAQPETPPHHAGSREARPVGGMGGSAPQQWTRQRPALSASTGRPVGWS
jgi:hypothetical protein